MYALLWCSGARFTGHHFLLAADANSKTVKHSTLLRQRTQIGSADFQRWSEHGPERESCSADDDQAFPDLATNSPRMVKLSMNQATQRFSMWTRVGRMAWPKVRHWWRTFQTGLRVSG